MALGSSATPLFAQAPAAAALLDLHRAVIVTSPRATPRERKAVQVLVEEVQKRTLVTLPVQTTWPAAGRPIISVGRIGTLPGGGPALATAGLATPGAEGFQIAAGITGQAPHVTVAGADQRGVLFGVGRLLRELRLDRGAIALTPGLRLSTTPQTSLRGHQLGYRPKTNSYDGWTVAMWDQYIRDLAIFGTNAIELIPPRSDDDPDSPHFTLPPMEMMVEMSRIADAYGLDVWIWYPALDKDYGDPATVDLAVKEWADVFRRLPRIDAILVPGGDPGHTEPRHMFALLERQTASLRTFHPNATMWLSPQGFTVDWMNQFYDLMAKHPAWLTGLVFGPQVRDPLTTLREKIDSRYKIRLYPDITHSLRAQYPVPDWDIAHAQTSNREPINPRPLDQTAIYRALDEYAVGFITYSEGCNDDVNKIVWSSLGWDRDAEPLETLRQFSRYFIGDGHTDRFAQGLLALERNWRGPLLTNTGVDATLQQFQAMERAAAPRDLQNWRVQQALYRAYYDAYVRQRLIAERALEADAMAHLAGSRNTGALAAVDKAAAALGRRTATPTSAALRARVGELAEALFQSIHMQLAVKPYGAIAVGRGATLDTIDMPLNDRVWLADRFTEIRAMATEHERLAAIEKILTWTDPGPGGFYDDLGDPMRQPHLVRGPGPTTDPGSFRSAAVGFGYRAGWRLSWMTHAESFYEGKVKMRYDGLDPTARYRVAIVYAGDVYSFTRKLRLDADGTTEVHGWTTKDGHPKRAEFDIPASATADGALTLTWRQEPGAGGAGRGNQIAEVWLMRAPAGTAQ
ncbi:MAG: hypothetical protein JJE40_10940 [Vicinamibacteria bacterium]|nr:hypothetical protein [Vicinamibacteria bacterium]